MNQLMQIKLLMKHPIKNTPSFYHSLDLYKDNGDIFISEGSGGNRVITFPTKDFIPETCQDLSQEHHDS